MHVLAVDTATPATSAAVCDVGPGHVAERAAGRVVDARAHGESLAPLIAGLLGEAGLAPGDLGAVVAGLGPGPFTGLRVGLVTAAAMGHALGVPTYGVCSLDGLGHGTEGTVLAATDARRKEIYWARYADGVRVEGPGVIRPADLVAETSTAVGDGAHKYADVLGRPIAEGPLYPRPTALVELAADRIRVKAPSEALTPLYLRRPDATPPAGVAVA